MYEPQACIKKMFQKAIYSFYGNRDTLYRYKFLEPYPFWNVYLFMVILFEKTDIKNAIKFVSMKKKIANEL